MSVTLKTIVKNNFWILEEDGKKVGTVNKSGKNQFVVHKNTGQRPEQLTLDEIVNNWGKDCFKSPIQTNANKNIVKKNTTYYLFDYPCASIPTNEMYDVSRRLPLYTKNDRSNSVHSAGYYIVLYPTNGWTRSFCPKLVTLEKYPYQGPFKTKQDMSLALKNSRKA
jgi:hypothetical protein